MDGGLTPAAHLHASVGASVRATNGAIINEPAITGNCGFNGDTFSGNASPLGFPDSFPGASFDQLVGNLKVTIIAVQPAAVPGAPQPSIPPALNDRSVYTAFRDFTPERRPGQGPWSGYDAEALSDDPNGPGGASDGPRPVLIIPFTPFAHVDDSNVRESTRERVRNTLLPFYTGQWGFDELIEALERLLGDVKGYDSEYVEQIIDELMREHVQLEEALPNLLATLEELEEMIADDEFRETLSDILGRYIFDVDEDGEFDYVDLLEAIDAAFPELDPEREQLVQDLLDKFFLDELEYFIRDQENAPVREFLEDLFDLEQELADQEFIDDLTELVEWYLSDPERGIEDLILDLAEDEFDYLDPWQRELVENLLQAALEESFREYVSDQLFEEAFLEAFAPLPEGPRVRASDIVEDLSDLSVEFGDEEFEEGVKGVIVHFITDPEQIQDLINGLGGLLPYLTGEQQLQLGEFGAEFLDDIEDPEADPEVAAEIQGHVEDAQDALDRGDARGAFQFLGLAALAAENLFGGPALDEGLPEGLDGDQLAEDLQDAVEEGESSGMPERIGAADVRVVAPPKPTAPAPGPPPPVASPSLTIAETILGTVLRTFIFALLPAISGNADVSFTLGGSGGGLAGVYAAEDGIKVKFTLTKTGMLEVEVEEKVLVGFEVSAGTERTGSVLGVEYGIGAKATGKAQGVFVNKQKYAFDPNKIEDVLALGILLAEGRVQFLGYTQLPVVSQIPVLVSGVRQLVVGPNTFLIEDRQAVGVKVAGGVKVEGGPSLPKDFKVDVGVEGLVGIERRPQAGETVIVFSATGEGAVKIPIPPGKVPVLDFLNGGGAAGGEIRLVVDARTGAVKGVEIKFEVKGDVSVVENVKNALPANLFGASEVKSAEVTVKGGGSLDVSISIPTALIQNAVVRLQDGSLSTTEFLAETLADLGTKATIKVKVKGSATVESGGEVKFAQGGGIGVKAKTTGTYEVVGTLIDKKPGK